MYTRGRGKCVGKSGERRRLFSVQFFVFFTAFTGKQTRNIDRSTEKRTNILFYTCSPVGGEQPAPSGEINQPLRVAVANKQTSHRVKKIKGGRELGGGGT